MELEGRREEERDSLERAIEATGAARREMPVELLEAHGRCLAALGERRRAEEVFRAHLAAAVSAGDAAAEAMAHGVLARLALDRGDLAAARVGAERSLLLARAARQPHQEASVLGLLASLYERTGKPDPALAHHARRLALATRLSDARQASDAHGDLARLALHRGRLREALVHLDRQATTARDAGHRRGESRARHGFGRVALARGHLLEAVEAFREAIASARAAGSASEEAAASVDLAHATLCLGDAPQALSVLLRAMSLAARDGDAETLADARVACGLAAEHRGDGEEAASWHREVLSARLALSGPTEVHAWLGLARAAALSGRPDRAVEPLDRATAIAAARGWPSTRTTAAALRAAFVGGDASHALALLAEHGESLPWAERIEAHVALAKATGDPWHFLEARRALDAAQVDLSPEARDTMDRGFPPARAAREGAGAVGGEHR